MTALSVAWQDIIDFNDEHFPRWRETDLIYLTNAMAGEVGEVCGDAKRMAGGGTKSFKEKPRPSPKQLLTEVADVFIYSILIAEGLGYGQEEFASVVMDKMAVNRERMRVRTPENQKP